MIKFLLMLLFACTCVLGASPTLGLKDAHGESLELTDVKLKAIVNLEAPYKDVQHLLTYKNSKDHPLEAIFHFPRNGDFIFHKFEAIFHNKTLVGKITAKEDNHTQPASSEVITLSIGKLQTNETVQILFSVIQPLKAVLNKFFELKFPAITRQDSPFIFDQDPKEWNIQVDIASKKPLTILSNPTHWLEPEQSQSITSNSTKYKALWNTTIPTYQDFTVYFAPKKLSDIEMLSVTHPEDPNDHIFQFSALPDMKFFSDAFVQESLQNKFEDGMLILQEVALNKNQRLMLPEYVFMIDRSDSMKGARFNTLKKVLIDILQSLPKWRGEVEILSFGSTSELYRMKNKHPSADGPSPVWEAIEYVQTLEADMGQKDLLKAMDYIKDRYGSEMMYYESVILLTDGEVSISDEIIQIVSKRSRYFGTCTLGIGSNEQSKSLLQNIASAGKCRSEFIHENEELGGKFIQLMQSSFSRFGFELVPEFLCKDQSGKVVTNDCCRDSSISADEIAEMWFYLDNEPNIKSCQYNMLIHSEGRQIWYEKKGEILDFGNAKITDTNFYHKIAYSSKLKSTEAKIKSGYYSQNPYKDEKSEIQKVIDRSIKYQVLSEFTQLVPVLQETVPSFMTTGSKRDIQSFEL